jgi:hypothetical protein
VTGMGRRLLELCADPSAARRMGERGRERADEFSARRMVDQLSVLYRRLTLWRSTASTEPDITETPADENASFGGSREKAAG